MGVLVGSPRSSSTSRTEPVFLSWENWQNIIRSQRSCLTLGFGMTFVVLTGGIDLSIASAAAARRDDPRAVDARRLVVVLGAGRLASALASGLPTASLIGVLQDPVLRRHAGDALDLPEFRAAHDDGETISLFSYARFDPSATHQRRDRAVPDRVIFAGVLYGSVRSCSVTRLRPRAVYAVGLEPRGGAADRHQRQPRARRRLRDLRPLGRTRLRRADRPPHRGAARRSTRSCC